MGGACSFSCNHKVATCANYCNHKVATSANYDNFITKWSLLDKYRIAKMYFPGNDENGFVAVYENGVITRFIRDQKKFLSINILHVIENEFNRFHGSKFLSCLQGGWMGSYMVQALDGSRLLLAGTLGHHGGLALWKYVAIFDVYKWDLVGVGFETIVDNQVLPHGPYVACNSIIRHKDYIFWHSYTRVLQIWKIENGLLHLLFTKKSNPQVGRYAMVLLTSDMKHYIDEYKNNDNLLVLLFGNDIPRKNFSFIDSFLMLNVNFDSNDKTPCVTECESETLNQIFGFNLTQNKSFLNIFKHCTFTKFASCLLENRYLLIIGGAIYYGKKKKNEAPHIIWFDFKFRQWYMVPIKFPSTRTLETYDCEVNIVSKPSKCIIIVPRNPRKRENGSFKLYLQRPLSWNCQRLLWIAHLKNIQNTQCHLTKLPKDLVYYLLDFCEWSLTDYPESF